MLNIKSNNDEVIGLIISNDASSIYACGEMASNNFPTTMAPIYGGISDQFVLKYDINLSASSTNYTLTVTKSDSGNGTVSATGCTLNWTGNTGKDSDNKINCGVTCRATYSGSDFLNLSFILNTGKSLLSVRINGMDIGAVHNVKIRSTTHYIDVVANLSN